VHPVDPDRQIRALRAITATLTAAAVVIAAYAFFQWQWSQSSEAEAAEPPTSTATSVLSAGTASTTTEPTTTTTTTSPPTTTLPLALKSPDSPPYGTRYTVPLYEAAADAKQLAVDIARWLTTYEEATDHPGRLHALASGEDLERLAAASEPLTHPGSWSRGEIIYPQLGGWRNNKVSMMVVTRQTVGVGAETHFSVVRTMDIRLARGEFGWEFDFLDSAGGTFDRIEDLALAHAVARDPRIEMPDSARLDILSGRVSPLLLQLMSEMADHTPYGVVTIITGHPYNVFETDRMSDHTRGRAIDLYRLGDRLVIDDRGPDSATKSFVEWLYDHPDVLQVGSPWDLDGAVNRRSFTDAVHQDHLHIAVKEVGHDD
jgi:hypothetical protein